MTAERYEPSRWVSQNTILRGDPKRPEVSATCCISEATLSAQRVKQRGPIPLSVMVGTISAPRGRYQNTALVNSAQLACCMPLLYLCKVINNFILDFNFEGGYMYTILILPYYNAENVLKTHGDVIIIHIMSFKFQPAPY